MTSNLHPWNDAARQAAEQNKLDAGYFHLKQLHSDSQITTWNQAADLSVNKIFSSLSQTHVNIGTLRTTFERLSISYFSDLSECSKSRASTLWESIGVCALEWGAMNSMQISKDYLVSTLVRKQRDYGHNNIAKYGRQGLIIRVHDKIARLENLVAKKSEAANEPIEDTVLDIAGYSAIGIMWESGTFLLPLE